MSDTKPTQIQATGEANGFIPAPGDKGKPIIVIGTNSIRAGFDATCFRRSMLAARQAWPTSCSIPTHTRATARRSVASSHRRPTSIPARLAWTGHPVLPTTNAPRLHRTAGLDECWCAVVQLTENRIHRFSNELTRLLGKARSSRNDQ